MTNDIIRIERINHGFWQYFDHPRVEKIWCDWGTGNCCVHYHDRSIELHIGCEGYLFQFGTPVSNDGKLLFMGSWEKGLYCYVIETGELLWHMKSTRITKIVVYDTYLIAARYGYYLAKINIATGEIIAKINSKGVGNQFKLDHRVCVDSLKGTLCVVNTVNMQIEKVIPWKVINPYGYRNCFIISVKLADKKVLIYGHEGDTDLTSDGRIVPLPEFCREIPLEAN